MANKKFSKKTCCIMQPLYIPWMGYFDLMDRSDIFVFYDDVQLVRRSWCTRNRIKTPQGELVLTVPIKKTAHRDDITYEDAQINSGNWKKQHLKSVRFNYTKAKYFTDVYNLLEKAYNKDQKYLADLNIDLIEAIASYLGIKKNTVRSSRLEGVMGSKDQRLVGVCEKVGANTYLSPQGSADYIESGNPGGYFTDSGISLYYQDFEHPKYDQLWEGFVSHLSIVDVIMNYGTKTLELIRSGQRPNYDYLRFREVMKIDD